MPGWHNGGAFMRGERVLTIVCAFALWLVSIGGAFMAVATATSFVYQLSRAFYVVVTQSPTFPVDKYRFLSVAGVAALLLIGVFVLHRPVRTNVVLTACWLGSLIGVLLYIALAISALVAR
jgi:hypothetical protein